MKITGKGVARSPESSDNIGVVSEIDKKIAEAKRWGIQLGIEIGLKRAMDITSRDLHNFKFPEGQIPIDMPLEQHAPKDDSTFEFSYQTYTERVMAKEAARRVRGEREDAEERKRRAHRIVSKNRRNRK